MAGQTDLLSDNFCGFNQAAASMYWIMDPVQNTLQYTVGEVGNPTGVGLHTPGAVIDVSSNIVAGGAQAGNVLTKCIPPAPPLPSKLGFATDASIRNTGNSLPTSGFGSSKDTEWPPSGFRSPVTKNDIENFHNEIQENFENNNSATFLNNLPQAPVPIQKKLPDFKNEISTATGEVIPNTTDTSQFLISQWNKYRRSAMDYSNVDWQAGFAGNGNNLHTEPQNLTYVIERMWLERGGLDSNQLIKQSWEPWMNNSYENLPNPKTGRPSTVEYLPNTKTGEPRITCAKVRQPYNIKFPFGIPPDNKPDQPQIRHHPMGGLFNATDVVVQGKSSPQFQQHVTNYIPLAFNYDATYTNGGCNDISRIDNPKMCSDETNDLTGVNSFNFSEDLPPSGLYPITVN